ncbi:ABC transporter ATP-binding protein [Novosphingobium sp.]|uniref:ABC transporter ATP-binding protein n=1 Tax=Novosphingobium sp. TaxID=1874826 RepID=UPI0025F6D223|nr:ABC transporter ATP-binding protein [Novosphingobium sp.]MCC6924855.1 ABC transporter ATP-binding protein [Novosphingobium sp.]
MSLAGCNLHLAQRLHGVSLQLSQGEVTAICGPNGAGKSSLLSALAGIVPLDQGEVRLDQDLMGRLPLDDRARRVGFLPQQAELAWDLSVETLAGLGRLPWSLGPEAHRQAIDRAIADMQLEPLRRRPLSRLSGGERARAMLARVLAGEPCWLLADEPLANLDLAHQLALLAHFRKLAGQGLGVVLVLHDLAQAMNHADRVVVLKDGQVLADGPPDQALDEAVIEQVWGVKARWLGDAGGKALVI